MELTREHWYEVDATDGSGRTVVYLDNIVEAYVSFDTDRHEGETDTFAVRLATEVDEYGPVPTAYAQSLTLFLNRDPVPVDPPDHAPS
jgi:hypothetical protein